MQEPETSNLFKANSAPKIDISEEVGQKYTDTILSHIGKFKFVEREFELTKEDGTLVKKYEYCDFEQENPQDFHRVSN